MLLDTHLALWYAYEPTRLPKKAAKLISARDSALTVSWASLWEVAIKASLGRDDFRVDPRQLADTLVEEGFVLLPLRIEHLSRVLALPWVHRDPFDRMLVAQAIEEKLTLLTTDSTLAGYGRMVRVL